MSYELSFFIKWFLVVLAVYRLSFEVAARQGPGGIFEKFRTWATIKYGLDNGIEEFITCPVCWSILFAIPFVFLFGWYGWESVFLWLSISGGVMLVHFYLVRLK